MTPPEVAPAPMIVCISSMNSIELGCLFNSVITLFSLFSKSPRYFVPASKAPRSSAKITLSINTSGTSPSTINFAKPSAIAVLPTPASPTYRGLFLRRRQRTWIVL